jgi:hypothetical protein
MPAFPSATALVTVVCLSLGALMPASAQTTKPKAAAKSKTSTKPDVATKPAAASKESKETKPALPSQTPPATSPAAKGAQGAVGPVTALPRVYAPTRPRDVAPKYPWRRNITTTIFWIGEAPDGRNLTPNHKSSWDTQWQENYGGYDDPNRENRTYDFHPKGFIPNRNPFYVALPFNDKTNPDVAAAKIPWFKTRKHPDSNSACHGTWIAIKFGNKTAFAQWEDCGPWVTDDHNYVFGSAPPKNAENGGAGLDVSPAVRDFLGISSGAQCDWRFCTPEEVPDGPWTRFGDGKKLAAGGEQDVAAIRAKYAELVRQREEWLKHNPAR